MRIRTRHTKATGFTIIESMIALAVTGMLVVSAFGIIGGRSRHVTFQQAINDLAGQITKTINEVQTGYNGFENITCSVAAGVKTIGTVTTPTTPQPDDLDKNADCIFIGKILQFNARGVAEDMRTISVIGTRLHKVPGSTEKFERAVLTLAESDPVLVMPNNIEADGLYDSVKRTPWGLELQEDSNPLKPTAFFIMQSLAPEGTSFVLNNRYATEQDIGVGAQNLYIIPMTTSNFSNSTADALRDELQEFSNGSKQADPLKEPLVLCFKDPARDNQFARIIVGPQTGDTADPNATFTGYGVTTEFTTAC